MIQRDRDGSTALGSLELLMRSPPLAFLGSTLLSLSLTFYIYPRLYSLFSLKPLTLIFSFSPFISAFNLVYLYLSLFRSLFLRYLVTPSTSSDPISDLPRHGFRRSSSSSSVPTRWLAFHPQQRPCLYSYTRSRARNVIMQLKGSFSLHQRGAMRTTLRTATSLRDTVSATVNEI